MAEAVVLAGLQWFASSPFLIDLLKKGYSYLGMDVNKKLRNLKNVIIPRMEILIEAAEKSPHKDRLDSWLKSLENPVYEAEDALDLHDYYRLKQTVKSSAGGIKNLRPPLSTTCSPVLNHLIKSCWSVNPAKRPDFTYIVYVLEKFDHCLKEGLPILVHQEFRIRSSLVDLFKGCIMPHSSISVRA